MSFLRKGTEGYIKRGRIFWTAVAAATLALDVTMFLVARAHFGTNRNVFSILAAVLCLPIGKAAVSAVMFWRARPCPAELASELQEASEGLPMLQDLYLTSYERNFPLAHLCAAEGSVIALVSGKAPQGMEGEFRKYLERMMKDNHINGVQAHLFTQSGPYIARLKELKARGGQETETDAAVLTLVKQLCI